MKENLETLVKKANSGDRKSLESVVMAIKDMVYNLSLKMLLFPEDAKDATQEILIRVITHLSTFNHRSRFKTWVYRVATNYLLTERGRKSVEFTMPFKDYADLIDLGHANEVRYAKNEGELALLEEEVKISCTHGLLLCLNRPSRVVYILGEILDINSMEGAEILEITPENFRKQLSRSRTKIRNFLTAKCGFADPKNPCRCTKKIDFLIDSDKIDPRQLRFAQESKRSIDLISKIGVLEDTVALYKTVPDFKTPEIVVQEIRKVIRSVNF